MADRRMSAKVSDVYFDDRPGMAPWCWFRGAVDVSVDLLKFCSHENIFGDLPLF